MDVAAAPTVATLADRIPAEPDADSIYLAFLEWVEAQGIQLYPPRTRRSSRSSPGAT